MSNGVILWEGANVGRSCYVTVFQAPPVIWKAYKAGKYPKAQNLQGLFAGKRVRLGAYGDPAASRNWRGRKLR